MRDEAAQGGDLPWLLIPHVSRMTGEEFQGGSEVLGAIVSTNVPDMDANEEGGSRETEYSIQGCND